MRIDQARYGLPGIQVTLKNYSVSSLLLELEKFRKITLADGQVVTTEMTKKQRLILEALKIM